MSSIDGHKPIIRENSGTNIYIKKSTATLIEQFLLPHFKKLRQRDVLKSELIHDILVEYCQKRNIQFNIDF